MRGCIVAIAIVMALLFPKLFADHDLQRVEVDVGLIVDMESWEGKIVKTSIEMAISDFHNLNHHYTTRLILHTRDSKGEPSSAVIERVKAKVRTTRCDRTRDLNESGSKTCSEMHDDKVGFGPILVKELLFKKNLSREGGRMVNVKGNEEKSIRKGRRRLLLHGSSSSSSKTRPKTKTKKLRIGVPLTGFRNLVNVVGKENNKNVTGFCIDVFEAAYALLPNYQQIEYEFKPYINFDTQQMLGTYNDLVDQLISKNYDALVGDVTITANRSNYVDFTIPFTDIGVGMVALDDSKCTWLFLKPLSKNLWIAIICFFILTGFVVWVIESPINHEFQGSPSQQIGTIFWFSFSTLVYAHRERLLSNSSKFVVLIWLFLVFILSSSYTATLASMMTVKQLQLDPRKSLIGYPIYNSSVNKILSNLHTEDFTVRPYSPSPKEYADALTKGSNHGGVSAIIDEIPYIRLFLAQYSNQNFYLTGTMPTTNGFGFVFPKGSPLVSNMSWAIAKLREDEKIKMLARKWFHDQDTRSFTNIEANNNNNNPVNPLSLDNFFALFLISGSSSALALLIFFFFYIHNKFNTITGFMVLYWGSTVEFCKLLSFRIKTRLFYIATVLIL